MRRPLLAAADFLGVEHLKLVCVATIEADLSIHSVCRALTVADEHDAAMLKDTCVNFIVTHFSAVHQTDGFKDLPRPLLDLVHQGISARLAAATTTMDRGVERLSLSQGGANSPSAAARGEQRLPAGGMAPPQPPR